MRFAWNKDSRGSWILLSLCVLFCLSTFSCAQNKAPSQSVQEIPKNSTINATSVKPDILGAAAAIEDFFNRRYTDHNAIHLESVLSAIGASAGFGSQMAIREGYIQTGQVSEKQAFVVVGTAGGQKYYYGDAINQLLFEHRSNQKNTVWDVVSGGAQYTKACQLPDIIEIVKYNAKTLGTPTFGIPRLPKGHEPKEVPMEVLRKTWPQIRTILAEHHIQPRLLGWVTSIAAQKVIIQKSNKIDPSLAAKIVMESALPMSKVDPETVIVK